MKFKITSSFKPTGDQPEAIEEICEGFKNNLNYQTLQGVTGSGKTFTVANVVERLQKPTLVLAHNKTLAPFTSRCAIPLLCKYFKPFNICLVVLEA